MNPAEFFKCLADDTRLRAVLLCERQGELCVCDLMTALALSQPKVSRHLALLRRGGLLIGRKQGQWVFYRINPKLPTWARAVIKDCALANTTFIQSDLARLAAEDGKVCC